VPDLDRTVDFARVWYGHALRTQDNGEPPASNPFLGGGGSGNENPLDWLLARQAVFLDETVLNPGATAVAGNPQGIFANGITPGSNVEGHSGVPAGVPETMVGGLTDFAFFGFEFKQEATNGGTMVSHAIGSLVGESGTTALLEALPIPAPPSPDDPQEIAYEATAVQLATYAGSRLLANAAPSDDYETWQIAQAHAILNEGCSDFAIEFAADMYGGGNTDNVAVAGGGTFAPDGQIDLDEHGNIAWYGWAELEDAERFTTRGQRIFSPATNYPPIAESFTAGRNASTAFVWRHDRFDAGVYNVSASGTGDPDDGWSRTTSSTNTALTPSNPRNAFCDWPYLIRIRYRLASGAPLFEDQNNNGSQDAGEPIIDSRNGIWFEQIIPVNRPLPVRVP